MTQLIDLKEICKRTSLSRAMINRHRSAGNFPAPVQLGEKRIAFVESEIDEWIDDRIAASRAKSKPAV